MVSLKWGRMCSFWHGRHRPFCQATSFMHLDSQDTYKTALFNWTIWPWYIFLWIMNVVFSLPLNRYISIKSIHVQIKHNLIVKQHFQLQQLPPWRFGLMSMFRRRLSAVSITLSNFSTGLVCVNTGECRQCVALWEEAFCIVLIVLPSGVLLLEVEIPAAACYTFPWCPV